MSDPKNTENGHKAKVNSELDKAFDMLSKIERRETLRFLRDEEDQKATLGDIADYLEDLDCEIEGHMELNLHHVYIPKLEEGDQVVYEQGETIRDGLIEYIGDEHVEQLLDCTSRSLEPYEEEDSY